MTSWWTVSDPTRQLVAAAIMGSHPTKCSRFKCWQFSHSCLFIYHITFRIETEETGTTEWVKITRLSLRDESTFVGCDDFNWPGFTTTITTWNVGVPAWGLALGRVGSELTGLRGRDVSPGVFVGRKEWIHQTAALYFHMGTHFGRGWIWISLADS